MWRKNRSKNKGSKCVGVDINRNYPFHWGGEGSSHDPCSQTYAGPSALSEPESNAVRNLIMDNRKRMKAYITLHAYGNWWLYPWVIKKPLDMTQIIVCSFSQGYNKDDSPNVKELVINKLVKKLSSLLLL